MGLEHLAELAQILGLLALVLILVYAYLRSKAGA